MKVEMQEPFSIWNPCHTSKEPWLGPNNWNYKGGWIHFERPKFGSADWHRKVATPAIVPARPGGWPWQLLPA